MNAEMSNNKKLPAFNKRTVAVLSETEMMQVDGGTTPVCAFALYSSQMCATGVAAGAVILYQVVVGF